MTEGLKIESYFFDSKNYENVYATVEWGWRDSKITDAEGKTVFEMKNVEVPKSWSQLATDIFASKYCRKAGVPNDRGHEWSLKQVVDRIVNAITTFGQEHGYFQDHEDAVNFMNDLAWLLIHQHGAFNSPVWFNVGLWDSYKIKGTGGNWAYKKLPICGVTLDDKMRPVGIDAKGKIGGTGTYYQPKNQYKRPQVSACFIQSLEDDLMSIFQLAKNEASIFKYGSGAGVNVSPLRGKDEKLSGGGKSSGVLSFLKMLDAAGGVIKSGGVTRRSAAARILDADHPEILDFIDWKIKEEEKAKALIAQGYDSDFNGEAYQTISGQNSNNMVRLTDEFMKSIESETGWKLVNRIDGETHKVVNPKELFHKICEAVWKCGDPGVQYHDNINKWHTCKKAGEQKATNPCSEFSWINDSSCNLASLNLVKFWKDGKFDVESFQRAVRIFIIAQDILVDLGSYPTKEIAKNSHEFRPLGLGYSNLGSLLMLAGYPYDSDAGRTLAALITSLMSGTGYETSAELAEHLGAFEKFEDNRESMQDIIRKHYEKNIERFYIVPPFHNLMHIAYDLWDKVNKKNHFRNAQCSLLAPVGTIGLLMDCDTTGIEAAFSLVSYKKLAGGGNLKMVNKTVEQALKNLGYNQVDIEKIKIAFESALNLENVSVFKNQHLPIFDCASKPANGERFISADGHIDMMAAVQPFLSGAISKTINLPNDATIDDVKAIFMKSWKLGLKAITIYRDGCKASQPLTVKAVKSENVDCKTDAHKDLVQCWEESFQDSYKDNPHLIKLMLGDKKDENTKCQGVEMHEKLMKHAKGQYVIGFDKAKENADYTVYATINPSNILKWGEKKRLPNFCKGERWRFRVGGVKLYLRTGNYEDGSLGEIWVDLDYKEGSTVRSLMNQYAIAISFCLQHGVPLQTLVDKFRYTKFEPSGIVSGIDDIKFATSVLDAVFAILEAKYIKKEKIQDIQEDKVAVERNAGIMSGQTPCTNCGSIDFLKTGNCYVCIGCGTSQGCS